MKEYENNQTEGEERAAKTESVDKETFSKNDDNTENYISFNDVSKLILNKELSATEHTNVASRSINKQTAPERQSPKTEKNTKADEEAAHKEGYFTIKPDNYNGPEYIAAEYDIKFILNYRKDEKIDDIPADILRLYSFCTETYCVIQTMPVIIKPLRIKKYMGSKIGDKKTDNKEKKENSREKRKSVKEYFETIKKINIRNKYISDLHGIAQVGLQGETPQPKLAEKSLINLQKEILMKEGGKIKNRHFVELGIKALILGVIAAVLGCVFMQLAEGAFGSAAFLINNNIYPYLFIFAGAMAGTWVSFGVRNLDMTFRDLAIMEEDMLKSFPRLFFVGVVSIIFMLFINSTIVTFDIGGIGTSDIMGSIELQILVGVVAGLLGNKLATGLYGKAKDAVKTGEDK